MEKTHKILMINNNNSFSSNFAGSVNSWKSFTTKAEKFIQKTQEHVLQGLNPGNLNMILYVLQYDEK